VSKKQMIMMAAVGLVGFAGSFVFALLTRPITASQADELNQQTPLSQETELKLPLENGVMPTGDAGSSEMKRVMTEKQLKSLIFEVREKIREYDSKLDALEARERRLQVTQDTLEKDTNELNNLRIELATIVVSLQERWEKLVKTRVRIDQDEKLNLTSIAATYDKMDAASASKILINMCADSQIQEGSFKKRDGSFDDAVKILHYMSERTKAKLLAELVITEPKLAAALCQRLKKITEE
jgi:hypothetical protein